MFSTPSPTIVVGRPTLQSNTANITNINLLHTSKGDYNECDYDDDDSDMYRYPDEMDSEEEWRKMRMEEIPVKEPMLNAVPKKSALKKKSCNEGSDVSNRPLVVRQENNTSTHG